jgi:Yip1-like protein
MTSTSVTPVQETGPQLSQTQRVIDTFIAPSKTFADLKRSASWWLPFLLMSLVSLLFVYVVDQKIGFRKVAENQLQMSPKNAARLEQLPPADRNRQMQQQTSVMRYFSFGYPLIILIWNLLMAAILFATFKFAVSADVKFKVALAVVMYASLPLIIKSLLAMLSVGVGASADSFTFQNPIASNPGYFINPADSRWLYGLCSALDIFMIWTLVLTAIGFSTVSRIKQSTSLLIVFGWYVIFVVATTGLGAAFS